MVGKIDVDQDLNGFLVAKHKLRSTKYYEYMFGGGLMKSGDGVAWGKLATVCFLPCFGVVIVFPII